MLCAACGNEIVGEPVVQPYRMGKLGFGMITLCQEMCESPNWISPVGFLCNLHRFRHGRYGLKNCTHFAFK